MQTRTRLTVMSMLSVAALLGWAAAHVEAFDGSWKPADFEVVK